MTPWQTVLQRTLSSAGLVMPQIDAAPAKSEDSTAAKLSTAAKDLLRSFVERATLAFRWIQQKSAAKFASRRMRITETVALGEKRFVTILQVDGQQLLIGSAAGQVTLLAMLEEPQGTRDIGLPRGQNV
jgi:hypothetical protein